MKKPLLITFVILCLVGIVIGSVQGITRMLVGILDGVPSNIGNVETYIERTRLASDTIETLPWEEYRLLEKERLRQETRYAEVAKEVLRKLASKGQLSE